MILTQAIAKSTSASIHIELEKFLKKLESKTLEEILNGKDRETRSIDKDIREIVNQSIHFNQKSEDDIIKNFAQIIFSANEYLWLLRFQRCWC